jgi:hypothetical protein
VIQNTEGKQDIYLLEVDYNKFNYTDFKIEFVDIDYDEVKCDNMDA